MSPSFATAMFVALVLVIFWRAALVMLTAFVLAAVLIGVGAMPGDGADAGTPRPGFVEPGEGPSPTTPGSTPAESPDSPGSRPAESPDAKPGG